MIEKKNNFKIEYTKGDTYALQMTFKNVTQDLTTAFFTVKENIDDEPLIEKTIGAGISKINENFYKQEIVYKLQLQAEDSRNLQVDFPYLYDLKIAVGNVIKTAISGNFIVKHNVTGVDRITTELADIEVDDFIDTDAETTPATSGIEYEQDPVARMLIGDLDNLTTTHKETVVDAINDNKSSITALETTTSEHDAQLTTLNGYFTNGEANNAIQATNADNAIKNNDDTYSGLTTDENGVLKVGNIVIPQKKLIWQGQKTDESGTSTPTELSLILNDIELKTSAHYMIVGTFTSNNSVTEIKIDLFANSAGQVLNIYCDIDGISSYTFYPIAVKLTCITGNFNSLKFTPVTTTGTAVRYGGDNTVELTNIYEIIE